VNFIAFSQEYVGHLEVNSEDVSALAELINSGRRAAIMCFERDHTQCHRSLLVSALLEEAGHEVRVYHL
jgi:hypothetical protein